jgi:xylulokinase
MLLAGIDIGTSFIKFSVVDPATGQSLVTVQCPETEATITSVQPGWAEQSPEAWWTYTKEAIRKANSSGKYDPQNIVAIGISYQMHGLVIVDKEQKVLRDSIIWCDSRAVAIGNKAFDEIGAEHCMSCLLNSPGNFTASKLSWVKENEPGVYVSIYKMMLPGDFIAMKLTGVIGTTSSALSEGMLWDFEKEELAQPVMDHFGFDADLIPERHPVFSSHGMIKPDIANELSLSKNIAVTYKAGDQLNNALSLNIMQPGEVAATAGTSGVIYAVTDQLFTEPYSRVNAFAHVNHTREEKRLGVLLCINGTGIMNKWIKQLCGEGLSYDQLNEEAASIAPGSEGLLVLPFGNGAERMFQNKIVGAQLLNIDLNKHTNAHIFRAVQEGVAFAFRYGLDIMRENGLRPSVIKAGHANMFLSDVFATSFVNATGVPVELYQNDGSIGAALGAGIGKGIFKKPGDAFDQLKPIKKMMPTETALYENLYSKWKAEVEKRLQTSELSQTSEVCSKNLHDLQ